jgi:FkbM family methyltransferase
MNKTNNQIEIKYGDGSVSLIDPKTHALLKTLEKEINKQRIQLPRFFDLKAVTGGQNNDDLLDFYQFILGNRRISTSQLFQDLFVSFIHRNKRHGTFLEFGATDGVEFSNSLMLERHFDWTGVLAEPSPQWHTQLFNNRKSTTIITDCIFSETGQELDFFVSDIGVLSTLEEFRDSDSRSIPANTQARNSSGYSCKVKTISLNDVMETYFDGKPVDYMSVDTEGSELLILQGFDFEKYAPKVVTVEHNFTDSQEQLDALFSNNNYMRMFKGYTQFDAWYVLRD